MPRTLAILLIAFFGTATLAHADTTPPAPRHHKHKKVQAKDDAKPAEAKDDLPDGPADVPVWMGKAVGNILTGDGPLLDDGAKPEKK